MSGPLLALTLPGRAATRVMERQALVFGRRPFLMLSGALEPIFYLLSLGLGLDRLVGDLPGPGGEVLSYAAFVAPGMLMVSAMVGATFDTTYNFFYKLHEGRIFDAVLATPLRPSDVLAGEIGWATVRGALHSVVFLVVAAALGLVSSPLALAAVPVGVVVSIAFGCVGAAGTTWVRGWADFSYMLLVIDPLVLFSSTVFPLSTFPEVLQWVVRATPLYHGVELARGLFVGHLDVTMFGHLAYLVAMAAVGWVVANRRIVRLLTP